MKQFFVDLKVWVVSTLDRVFAVRDARVRSEGFIAGVVFSVAVVESARASDGKEAISLLLRSKAGFNDQ